MWTLEVLHRRGVWLRVNAKIYTDSAEVNQDFDALATHNLYLGARILEYKAWCFDEPASISISRVDEGIILEPKKGSGHDTKMGT